MEEHGGMELLKVAEIQKLLKLSKGKTYQLVNMKTFPTVRIGRAIRVPRGALETWIKKQCQEEL